MDEEYGHPNISGECVGVGFEDRSVKDRHVTVVVYCEDDGNWCRQLSISSHWLDEMIDVLQQARRKLKGRGYEPDDCPQGTFGYRRKLPKPSKKK